MRTQEQAPAPILPPLAEKLAAGIALAHGLGLFLAPGILGGRGAAGGSAGIPLLPYLGVILSLEAALLSSNLSRNGGAWIPGPVMGGLDLIGRRFASFYRGGVLLILLGCLFAGGQTLLSFQDRRALGVPGIALVLLLAFHRFWSERTAALGYTAAGLRRTFAPGLHLAWLLGSAVLLFMTPFASVVRSGPLVLALAGAGQALQLLHLMAKIVLRAAPLHPTLAARLASSRPPLDLESFEHKVLRQPQAAPRPQTADAVLVESGSFRVDVSRLLDKLRDHQLPDPKDFILAWLRCATASGAKDIGLDPVEGGLRMTFDGRPFSSQELGNPYGALLDPEASEALRGRHFAYGLLAAQRLKPDSIKVFSGPSKDRAVMVLADKESSSGSPSAEPGKGTVIELRWPETASKPDVQGIIERAVRAFGLCKAELRAAGSKVNPYPWEASPGEPVGKWQIASGEGCRGAVRHFVPAPDELPKAEIHVYVLGTFIQRIVRHQYSSFEAYLACDDLALDISQTRVADLKELEQRLETLL
ncbi:MAG: hypothetical protein HY924_14745 [Elusimicrobia bacterium]|nr:hypothetical protein [Elusimicrobiota bacterium]